MSTIAIFVTGNAIRRLNEKLQNHAISSQPRNVSKGVSSGDKRNNKPCPLNRSILVCGIFVLF